MIIFQKHTYLALLFCWITSVLFSQDVKLGLPIGHIESVEAAKFSPDGNYILTVSGMTAKLFEATTGVLVYSFSTVGYIEFAEFDSTGRYIITGSIDRAKIFELSTGKLINSLKFSEDLSYAEFSPNGIYIATCTYKNEVKIFETFTGNLIHELDGHYNGVTSVKFSPDGKYVVTASYDGTARIFNSASGTLLHILRHSHDYEINSAEFSSDGKFVVTASNDDTAKIFETSTGNLVHTLLGHSDDIKSARFSSDGKYVVTASNDGTAKIFKTSTGNLVHSLNDHNDFIRSAEFSSDGKYVVTASWDDTAKIFETHTGNLVHSFVHNLKPPNEYIRSTYYNNVNSAKFSPDGKYIVTASSNRTVKLFESKSGKLINTLKGLTNKAGSLKFCPNNKYLITEYPDNNLITVTEMSTGFVKFSFEYTGFISSDPFSPDGRYIILPSSGNIAKIYDIQSGNLIRTLNGHKEEVVKPKFSNSGKYAVTSSKDYITRVFEFSSGKLIHSFIGNKEKVSRTEFSSKDKYILASTWRVEAKVFDVLTGNEELRIGNENFQGITSVRISPNEKYLVAASDKRIKLFEISTGEELFESEEMWGFVHSLKFSPDGKYIVVDSDDDGRSKIFEVPSGKLLYILENEKSSDRISSSRISNDSKLILTLNGFAGISKLFDISSGNFQNLLIHHNTELTSAEFNNDGNYVGISSEDGSMFLFDTNTGKQLIRSIIFDNDPSKWIHLHPSGLFDASPSAMELMYWTKGLEVIEFSQLKDRYWFPGLWENVMTGETLPDVRNMSELKLQPKVNVGKIVDGQLPIHLIKRDGGYGKVTLFINGKETMNDVRPSDMDYSLNEQTLYVSIKDHPYLLDGKNEITVKASSEDGFVQGRGIVTEANITKKDTIQPQFFAVVVGVGDYANDVLNLKYTVNDAEAISKAMHLGAENLFSKDRTHIYTITSNGNILPNKSNIKSVFDEISTKANAEDIIAVYLSGHGITWGGDQGDFYFLTSEATATSNEAYNDPVIRENNTISTSEWVDWLKEIPALKQVMIIDACGSGKAVDNLILERDIEPSQIKAIDRMKDRTGMYIISGCTADAVSYEASMYGQGLLTYSILQAIKGAALKEDKYVDIFTIMDYARETVPKLAEGIGGVQEPQLLIPKGGSFDIGMLEAKDKEAIPLASPKTVFVRSALLNVEEFEDNLGLSELLNKELSLVSSKGISSPLVYFDSAKYPNACKISGGYTIGENEISMSLKLRCGKDLKSFNLNAQTKEALIKKIIDQL